MSNSTSTLPPSRHGGKQFLVDVLYRFVNHHLLCSFTQHRLVIRGEAYFGARLRLLDLRQECLNLLLALFVPGNLENPVP